jgi:hypothetical protein
MKKGDLRLVVPPNFGWLEYTLNSQEMDYVWRCIKNKKESLKNDLAGNIFNSYQLIDRGDWFWVNVLKPLTDRYEETKGLGHKIPTIGRHPYGLKSWWVNYQKQNEFNPLHDHTGVYSFVIWVKIPIEWDEQNGRDIARTSNDPNISSFQFVYNNILGEVTSYKYALSSRDEGRMLFFPSRLNHLVYPFYDCDEERITVSGNIALDTLKR